MNGTGKAARRSRLFNGQALATGLVLLLGSAFGMAAGAARAAGPAHLIPGDPGACRTCHGAAASGGVAIAPADNTLCYSCHTDLRGPVFRRAAFEQGAHGAFWTLKSRTPYTRGPQRPARRGLCVNCHDPHEAGPGRASTWLGTPQDSTALCVSCHLDTQAYGAYPGPRIYAESPHGNPLTGVARSGSGAATGECLNCHDPHGLGYPKLLATPRRSDLCVSCHAAVRQSGVHASPPAVPKQGVRRTYPGRDPEPGSCVNCHNPHGALDLKTGGLTGALANAGGAELCYQCHTALRFDFASLSHHPVDEPGSGLTCQSCHNPHAVTRFQPVTSPDRPGEAVIADDNFCLGCHDGSFGLAKDVRGAHAARGSCLSCHAPHGSNRQDLLRT